MKKAQMASLALVAVVSAGGATFAQRPGSLVEENVTKGLAIRYRAEDLCREDRMELLPPSLGASLARAEGAKKRKRLEEFLKLANDEVGLALGATAAKDAPTPGCGLLKLEVRLLEFRESNRARNIASSLPGGFSVDPGSYRLELAVLNAVDRTEVASATVESTPSIRSLIFGSSFSRQSAIRKDLRSKLRKLHQYWERRKSRCQPQAKP